MIVSSARHRPGTTPAAAWSVAVALLSAGLGCLAVPLAAGEVPNYLEQEARADQCNSAAALGDTSQRCAGTELPENGLASRVNIFTKRGYEWLEEEEPLPAVSDFSRALILNPTVPTALKGRARAFERLEQYQEALNDWTSLIALHPRDPELYSARAQTRRLNREYDEAVSDYTRAIALDQRYIEGYIGRALAYDALDRLPAALADFEAAQKVDDKAAAIYLARAEMWERRGQPTKAIPDFKAALFLSPQDMRARRGVIELTGSPYAGRRLSE
ncbi:MAG: tetratricopeptide repeat protein [Alphaproteobacteria bacterium]|nr:tetratricopeptide repeat protein [Alphaproteobacteria bacterium]